MTDLGTAFNPRRNSLNALRLLFAAAVIVGHSPLGGREGFTGLGAGNDLGAWSVSGFFVISGFLITDSRQKSGLGTYLWRRFLRIYPAFVVVLLVTAFVLAPLSALVAGEYSLPAAANYVVKNLALYVFAYDIQGTLTTAPIMTAWNGSLWTLFYEAVCYVLIGVAVSLIPRRWLPPTLWVLFVGGTALTAAHTYFDVVHVNAILHMVRLGTFFIAGALIYLHRERIVYNWQMGAVSAAVLIAAIATGTFSILAPLPLAYLCMWLGIALPLHRVGAKNDISYGMYIYAFPAQQLLAITVGPAVPMWVFAILSIAATTPLAWGSWLAVERPAMRLRRAIAPRHASVRPSVVEPAA